DHGLFGSSFLSSFFSGEPLPLAGGEPDPGLPEPPDVKPSSSSAIGFVSRPGGSVRLSGGGGARSIASGRYSISLDCWIARGIISAAKLHEAAPSPHAPAKPTAAVLNSVVAMRFIDRST